MRAVIHLNDYDPSDDEIVHETHKVGNPQGAADDRAVVSGVYVEWFPGGGNVHVTDDRVEEVAEMMDGDVLIILEDREQRIRNAELVGVYA